MDFVNIIDRYMRPVDHWEGTVGNLHKELILFLDCEEESRTKAAKWWPKDEDALLNHLFRAQKYLAEEGIFITRIPKHDTWSGKPIIRISGDESTSIMEPWELESCTNCGLKEDIEPGLILCLPKNIFRFWGERACFRHINNHSLEM